MSSIRPYIRSEKARLAVVQFRANVRRENLLAVSGDEATVWLHGFIDDYGFSDSVSAKEVIQALSSAREAKTVHLRINSYGGNAADGFAIYSQLAAHPGNKIVHIDGMAASAATIPILAASDVRISAAGMLMIHEASGTSHGPAAEHLKAAANLEKMTGQVAELYAKHTSLTVEALRSMMAAETYLSAQEAVDFRFASSIEAEPVETSSQSKMASETLTSLAGAELRFASCNL